MPLPESPAPPVRRRRGNPNWIANGNPRTGFGGAKPQHWQPPAQRAEYLTTKYRPDQIIEFAKLIASGKKTLLSSQDAIVCVQLANILELRDGVERERLYDRLFGKVPDRNINLNMSTEVDVEKLSQQAKEMLARLAD